MSKYIIVLLLTAIFLAVTNPTTADFQDYMRSQAIAQSNGLGTTGAVVAGVFASELTGMAVQRTDLVVASVYLLRMNGKVYPWIGVLKNFFPLPPHK